MKTYYRLTFEERGEISRLLSQKCSFNVIANCLGKDKSRLATKSIKEPAICLSGSQGAKQGSEEVSKEKKRKAKNG